jgi:hypothetical protein
MFFILLLCNYLPALFRASMKQIKSLVSWRHETKQIKTNCMCITSCLLSLHFIVIYEQTLTCTNCKGWP